MAVKRKSWLELADAAVYLDVASSTVRRWIAEGSLRAAPLPTGHLRILVRDVVRRLIEQGRPVPDELGSLAHKHVLIVDPDRDAAGRVAAALQDAGGCRVTVAENAPEARGLLNAARPDLVLLGVRSRPAPGHRNGAAGLFILASLTDDALLDGSEPSGAALRVSDILASTVDEREVVSRVANVLLA